MCIRDRQTTVEVEGMFGRLEWRVERVCKPTASQLRALPIVLAVNLLCICVLAAGSSTYAGSGSR